MFYENMETVRQLLKLRNQVLSYTEDEKLAISKLLDEVIRLKVQELAQSQESEYAQMEKNNRVFDS